MGEHSVSSFTIKAIFMFHPVLTLTCCFGLGDDLLVKCFLDVVFLTATILEGPLDTALNGLQYVRQSHCIATEVYCKDYAVAKGKGINCNNRRLFKIINLCSLLPGVNLLVGTENGLKLLDRSGQGKVYPLINSRRFQQMDVLEGLNLLITISGHYCCS